MQPDIKHISTDDVYRSIEAQDEVMILDVRTAAEVTKGYIQGSVHVPVIDITNRIEGIVPNKNKPIYVYCLSGSRSDIAVGMLNSLGYTQAFSMDHGLLEWRAKKYPLITA